MILYDGLPEVVGVGAGVEGMAGPADCGEIQRGEVGEDVI